MSSKYKPVLANSPAVAAWGAAVPTWGRYAPNDLTVCVAVNRRLAATLVDGHYVKVSLTERLALAGATARALHARLSTQIRSGKSFRFTLQSIEKRVWGESISGSTQRNRHSRLRAAIAEIGRLEGWQADWQGIVVTFQRASGRVSSGTAENLRQRHGIPATGERAEIQSPQVVPGY